MNVSQDSEEGLPRKRAPSCFRWDCYPTYHEGKGVVIPTPSSLLSEQMWQENKSSAQSKEQTVELRDLILQ